MVENTHVLFFLIFGPIAQWWSKRLITVRMGVRVSLGPPMFRKFEYLKRFFRVRFNIYIKVKDKCLIIPIHKI